MVLHNGSWLHGDSAARLLMKALLDGYPLPDGFYHIIVDTEEKTLAAVDHLGTRPLFYRVKPDFAIAAHPAEITAGGAWSDEAVCGLLAAGYTFGEQTLYDDVREVPAGARIQYHKKDGGLKVLRPDEPGLFSGPERTPQELYDCLDEGFKALPDVSPFTDLRLSLSGGLDSRVILGFLLRHGRRASAFTYGSNRDPEWGMAAKLAGLAGLPHTFHDFEQHRSLINDESRFGAFLHHASMGRSIPHEQDFVSAHLFDENQLFVGGHSGDVISGGFLKPELLAARNRSDVVRALMYRHAMNLPHLTDDFHELIKSSLTGTLPDFGSGKEGLAASGYRFNHNNRQRKYIVNSVRAYTHRSIPFWLPLYTRAVTRFFLDCPLGQLKGQRLYKEMAAQTLFTGRQAFLARTASTTALRVESPDTGMMPQLRFRFQTTDRRKWRKKLFHRYTGGYALPLAFLLPGTTDRELCSRSVRQTLPEIDSLADKLENRGCPVASRQLRKTAGCKGAQLNINGFYTIRFLRELGGN